MPIIVSQAQIQTVKTALAAVQSNGQALAACNASIQAAANLAGYLRAVGGPIREQAASDLDTYAARVDAFRGTFSGSAATPVNPATWAQASNQIFTLYMLAFTLESTMPSGQDFGDGWGAALSYAVQQLPTTINNAVRAATSAVTSVVGATLWGTLQGTWPILVAAGSGLVLLLLIKRKLVEEGVHDIESVRNAALGRHR